MARGIKRLSNETDGQLGRLECNVRRRRREDEMSIKYARLSIAVHGLDTDKEALEFLVGWLRAATFAGLMGHNRDSFRFRNEFESDIEVEVEETAGDDSQPNIEKGGDV